MDHFSTGIYLLAALGVAGSLRVLPLILEDLVGVCKRSLDAVGDLVRFYRTWRNELWPPSEPIPPPSRNVVSTNIVAPLPRRPARVPQPTLGQLF